MPSIMASILGRLIYHAGARADVAAMRYRGDGPVGTDTPSFCNASRTAWMRCNGTLVEQAITKQKAYLRKLAPRSPQSLTAALREGLELFTAAECATFLRHSGYGQPKRNLLLVLQLRIGRLLDSLWRMVGRASSGCGWVVGIIVEVGARVDWFEGAACTGFLPLGGTPVSGGVH
jgi:hypothetical protein